jgi:hypothetical protein
MTRALESDQVVLQLTATDIAWLAETADGSRSVDLILVKNAKGEAKLRPPKSLEPGDEIATEIKVRTEKTLPSRIPVLQVICQLEGHDLTPLLAEDGWDAVFWTESSVEKFLYPYYRSQRLWSSTMDDLKAKFDSDPDAVAIAHRAPSTSVILDGIAPPTIAVGKVLRDKATRKPETHWKPMEHYLAGK